MRAPFVWFDLTVPEDTGVAGFYQGLFGWQAGPGAGEYQDWLLDRGEPWAGTTRAGALPAGRWVPYVAVDDLDAAVKKAVDLGGTVVRDKLTGPAGTSVTVSDPNGTLVALFVPAAGQE
jgi:predicted enzyme related to lactoylglutathione lyase